MGGSQAGPGGVLLSPGNQLRFVRIKEEKTAHYKTFRIFPTEVEDLLGRAGAEGRELDIPVDATDLIDDLRNCSLVHDTNDHSLP